MKVVVEGVEYVPATQTGSGIGIAITAHNRPEILAKALAQHAQYLPTGATVVVVDDGSQAPASVPEWASLVRHKTSQGIVAAKNASLKALLDAGCTELFLWDDDAWPTAPGWHEPYIASPEPHLAYQFLDLSGPKKLNDLTVLHQDAEHIAYSGQRGVMLYYRREVIDRIGGFDWAYGRGMYEHSDLALRIYHAGLTTWAFADIAGSDKLIHSLDEHEQVERSVALTDRRQQVQANVTTHNHRRDTGYCGYSPILPPRDVVITSLLTSSVDPQRGKKMAADPGLLTTWAASIKGADAIVLADELATAPTGATVEPVPAAAGNPYFQRWMHTYRWLRAHPEVRWCWVTDGTDVQMLHQPWEHMDPGKIYLGSEPKTLADEWVLGHHPAKHLQDFLHANAHRPMLNAGLVGGDRDTVMAFAHQMMQDHWATQSRRFWRQEAAGSEVGDMATLNLIAYQRFADRIITGPQVHTVFRSGGVGKEFAWWMHK